MQSLLVPNTLIIYIVVDRNQSPYRAEKANMKPFLFFAKKRC